MVEAPAGALARTDFHAAIRRNERNTVWLCLIMVLIGMAVGYVIGWAVEIMVIAGRELPDRPPVTGFVDALVYPSLWGLNGSAIMLAAGGLWIIIALVAGDRVVLAMAGARQVSADEEPRLHNVVEEMALAAGLPKPRVAVMESPALNAFATGLKPEKSAIAVTRGLLDRLERQELQGVVAHEMSHIANNDILYATSVSVIVGLIVLVADMALRGLRYGTYGGMGRGRSKGGGGAAAAVLVVLLVFMIAAPLAARLVQMAVSREREYLADATAVKFTRNPLGLIGALEKIDGTAERYEGANRAIQHLFIANPLRKFGADAPALFSTHPSTAERIGRLRDLH
jgi:heat shock protein HtpX